MALTNVKGLHTTPGIYQKETEIQPAYSRTGITTLGLVGETLTGPAFTPISIANWREFVENFGGTSTEIYKGSKYPRYELPYIAKDYLTESENLYVTRVLGLSGYNAGKAWFIKASSSSKGKGKDMLIGVIRSRGHYVETYGTPKFSDSPINHGDIEKNIQYIVGRTNQQSQDAIPADLYIEYPVNSGKKYTFGQKFFGEQGGGDYSDANAGNVLTVYGYCGTNYEFDKLLWDAEEVYIAPSGVTSANFTCGKSGEYENTDFNDISSSPSDFGTFKLVVKLRETGEFVEYNISLNPNRKDYIYNILGSTPENGNTPIFVEELYDVAFQQLVQLNGLDPENFIDGIELGSPIGIVDVKGQPTEIYNGLVERGEFNTIISNWEPVKDIVTIPNQSLLKYNLNERFLYSYNESIITDYFEDTVTINTIGTYSTETVKVGRTLGAQDDGKILTVKMDVDSNGKKTYNYHYIITIKDGVVSEEKLDNNPDLNPIAVKNTYAKYVFVKNQELFYVKEGALDLAINGTGVGAQLTAGVDLTVGNVINIPLTTKGTGYNPSATTIEIIGDGEGATASAVIDGNGNFDAITVTNGGVNYTTATATIVGTTTGTTAVPGTVQIGVANGKIFKIDVLNGGSGYTVGSTTLDINGSGQDAQATITVTPDGNITGLTATNTTGLGGSNIASVVVNINSATGSGGHVEAVINTTSGEIEGYKVINGGKNYLPSDTVTLTDFTAFDGFTMTQPTGVPTLNVNTTIGSITSVTMDNMGFGYLTITQRVIGDVSDYREQYRYASTPWVVSQMIGTFGRNEVKKLFRFHTVSDGNKANLSFKVSIYNIDPDNMVFDVVVRDFADYDANVGVLESFKRCSLNPADSNYILNKIGDFYGSTQQKSKFIQVEIADNDAVKYCFPAGFLGIPVRDLGVELKKPDLKYNTGFYSEIKERRQYFGFSDISGIDADALSYKGRSAYTDGLLTDGFHLDSRISDCNTLVDGENPGVDCSASNPDMWVKGIYTWQTPSIDELGEGGESPMITSSEDIIGTIYENVNVRKFTLCFYGGFDGWDTYRSSRSTKDNFKANRYKGVINANTGQGDHFSYLIKDNYFGFKERGITSDYYAFWGGYLTMQNPQETPINVFATPGIDYVNDTLLAKSAVEVVEQDYNQKTIYIITTPDKPFGANDSPQSMYTPEDVVYNLDAIELDSSYTASYYPWCRYYDDNESKTIFLPVTRDIVRNIANIDRTSYAWYPPAGDLRGVINCLSARTNLKIDDTDTLYSGRINPIRTYASDQTVVSWGQKNFKISYNNDKEALTRIGVRRMMIRIKELVERANRSLIFTPNDSSTANIFKSNTSAILNDVRANRGITDYRIEVDESVEARENRTLPVKIWIVPITMLEYIEIEWVITPQGMDISALT